MLVVAIPRCENPSKGEFLGLSVASKFLSV